MSFPLAVMCDKCTCKQDAERGVRLTFMPPVLAIHLKRFAIQSSTDRRGRTALELVKARAHPHTPPSTHTPHTIHAAVPPARLSP